MSAQNSATLDKVARLIARGRGPIEAARRAGRRGAPSATKAPVKPRPPTSERNALPPPDAGQDVLWNPPRKALHTLPDAEWLAKYAPKPQGGVPRSAG